MRYFRHKTSRFGSLLSLTIVCALMIFFILFFPTVWQSSAGRIFAVLWGLVAVVIAGAHVRRLLIRKERDSTYIYPVVLQGGKHKRTKPKMKMAARGR